VGYSLWDIENHQEILFIHAPSWYAPKWSPDGSRFIVGTDVSDSITTWTELVVIDMNGNIEQITDLNTIYPNMVIGEYSWSPDGDKIAFWISTERALETYEELMVLDINTGVITNYCVRGRTKAAGTDAPLWSPDSTQIVIDSYAYGSSDQVIMVDIVQGYALQLTESRDAFWWLRTFPDVWASP
jgi:Tol biopolymer transport system component